MFFALLILIAAGQQLSNNVGKVLWPTSTWVLNPVMSTSWHAAETVTLTFYFASTVEMTSGLLEVDLPSGFAVSTLTYPLTSKVLAMTDYSVSFSSIVLPTTGVYGPVALKLRISATGTIIAINQFFANIYIDVAKPVPTAGTLSATFYDITQQTIYSSSSIYFDFTISQDLWKFDVFYLYVDSHFNVSSPTCQSLKVIGQYNNLNGTSSNVHSLACSYDSTNNRVVVYGLGVDLFISQLSTTGSIAGRILVTGFTNPIADYDDSTYLWKLYIGRFGLNTFIAAYQGSGPSTNPGTISVTSWVPHKSMYSASQIPIGMTLYMDLTFVLPHQVPKTGAIVFAFSGGVDNLGKSWRYFVSGVQSELHGDSGYIYMTPYIGSVCTVSSATSIICTGFTSAIPAGTITLTTYTYFVSTSPSIMTITTYVDSQVTIIDQVTANPATIIYASSTLIEVASYFNVYFAIDLDITGTTDYQATVGTTPSYMFIKFNLPVNITSSSAFTVTLPISTSTQLYNIKNGGGTVTAQYGLDTSVDTVSFASWTSTSAAVSGNTVTFSVSSLLATQYMTLAISLSGGLTFPYVGSNLLTYYEASLSCVVSSVTYVYAKGLSFIPAAPALTLNLFCTDPGIAGLPATVSFTPSFSFTLSSGFDTGILSTYNMYIDFSVVTGLINSDFDSGLSVGGAFPFTSSTSGTLVRGSSGALLTFSGFTSLSYSTPFSLTFPFGLTTNLYSYQVQAIVYYLDSSNSNVQYQLMSSLSNSVPVVTNSAAWTTQTLTGTASFPTSTSTGNLVFSLKDAGGTSGTIGFLFPPGFTFSSGSITQASAMTGYSFSSSNIYYKTPGIFASLSASNALSGVTSFTVAGVTTAGYFNPSSSSLNIIPVHSSGPNAVCVSSSGTYPTITLTPAVITSATFLPAAATGASVNNLSLNLTATFQIINAIPAGGSIVLTFSTGWLVTSTSSLTLTIAGLAIASPTYTLGTTTTIQTSAAVSSSSLIVVYISNCVPPANTGTINTQVGHLNQITTYATSDKTQQIDQWTNSAFNSLTLSPSLSALNSTVYSVQLFPNATSTSAFFYTIFSFPNNLPIGAQILVTSPTSSWLISGDVSSVCSCSLNYSSCQVTGSTVTVTLAQAYVMGTNVTLMLDHALVVQTSGTTSSGVQVSSTYYGITVDNYVGNGFFFNVSSALSLNVSLNITPLTTSEFGNYSFTFGTALPAGTVIYMVFPVQFDYFLGASVQTYIVTQPTVFYIPCTSTFGSVQCQVQHRAVSVTLSQSMQNQSITLLGIYNPAYQSSYSNIKVYAVAGNVTYQNEQIAVAGISQFPSSNVQIRSLVLTNSYLQGTSSYIFGFYLNGFINANVSLIVTFPKAFLIDRDLQGSLVCTLSYVNTSTNTSSSLTNQTIINTTGICINIGNNQLQVTLTQNFTFSLILLTYLEIDGLTNPENGRQMPTALDSTVYTVYNEWVTQFTITLLTGSSYSAKSYTNVNAAYTGYYDNSYSFLVNNYNPITYQGTIVIIPGTQTQDLYITTSSAFKSALAQVMPKNINNPATLEFTSTNNYKIYSGGTYVQFRVAVDISNAVSLNYISWALNEVPQGGGSSIYTAPVKTRVELYPGTAVVSVGSIPSVSKGSTSLPISVSVNYSPHTELIVAIVSSDANITVYPSMLEFTRGVNQLYYQVTVSPNFTQNAGYQVNMNYILSGTDSAAYTISSSSFTIADTGSNVPVIQSVAFTNVGQTKMTATVTTNTAAILCWQLAVNGTASMTLSQIQANTSALVGNSTQLSFAQQVAQYVNSSDVQISSGESWTTYQRTLYKAFVQESFTGCTFSGQTSTTLFAADWLWAETSYMLVVYAGYQSSNTTVYQSTSAFSDAAQIAITVQQGIDKSYIPTVTSGLSKSLGIDSSQLELVQSNLTSSSSLFVYYIFPDRHSTIVPLSLAQSSTLTYLQSSLASSGIIGTMSSVGTDLVRGTNTTNVIKNLNVTAYSMNTVTVSINASSNGEVCCVALTGNSSVMQPGKALIGLNDSNQAVSSQCRTVVSNTTSTLQVIGLANGTKYVLTCFQYDNYLAWPSAGSYVQINATTLASSGGNTVSAAEIVGVVVGYFLVWG